MARHGLAWPDLAPSNPRLIMLSISGFGQQGPESQRAAYAAVLHAESGFVARQSIEHGTRPTDPVLSIADFNAGLHGLVAVLSALHLRGRTGEGQYIDLAMHDTMLMTDDYVNFAVDGAEPIRGGGEVWDAPGGGHVMVTGEFRLIWKLLVRHHGLVDPTPPGASLAEKIRLRREAVANFYLSFPDREALFRALDEVNLAWGHVRTTAEGLRSPTARARGTVAPIDDRGGGVRDVIQSPYRFSNASSEVRGGPAYRGEHNRAVLADWLELSPLELDELAAKGVIMAEERRAKEVQG